MGNAIPWHYLIGGIIKKTPLVTYGMTHIKESR